MRCGGAFLLPLQETRGFSGILEYLSRRLILQFIEVTGVKELGALLHCVLN